MKWIEIIELRSANSTREQLETDLQEFLDLVEEKKERQTVKVYSRMMIDTDFSIHLFHDSNKIERCGSPLGLRLVSGLKAYGMVNHTVWIEKQKDSLTQ